MWVSEADRYMKERDKAREENAKLKEEILQQQIEIVKGIEENERLKAELKHSSTQNKLYQLDEAFKYYHEMTKEQAQEHCQAFLSEFD